MREQLGQKDLAERQVTSVTALDIWWHYSPKFTGHVSMVGEIAAVSSSLLINYKQTNKNQQALQKQSQLTVK